MDENRPSTTCYLAETFEPRNTATGRRAEVELIRRAVERLGLAGVSVRHLRSLYIADEETALHLFEAGEPTAVAQALHGAGLEADRIGPVTRWPTRRGSKLHVESTWEDAASPR